MRFFKTVTLILALALCLPLMSQKTTESKSELTTENIEKDSKALDKEVSDFSAKIESVIKDYQLMDAADVKILPYRMQFIKGDGYIELTRHTFIRKDIGGEIIGMRTKALKIYSDGNSISKMESTIFERNYLKLSTEKVLIVDPSPTTEDTSDITFTHEKNDKPLVDAKKMSEIKNTAAFPVANNIKRDFYVPHLSYFYYSIRTIGETYNKNIKDSDTILTDFLKESTEY